MQNTEIINQILQQLQTVQKESSELGRIKEQTYQEYKNKCLENTQEELHSFLAKNNKQKLKEDLLQEFQQL